MILETAYWNSAGDAHSALAAEAAFLSYSIEHSFNEPAMATVVLADPTGAIAQKYDVDTNAVYIGPGRAKIQDPDGTCIFEGRIIKAQHNMAAGRVTLLCQDWLSQLDEDRINYDMREILDGSELRQSSLHADPNNATYVAAVYTNTVPAPDEYFMYDDAMSWADDLFNDKFVVFTSGMAGKITLGTGPYSDHTTAGTDVGGFDDVWKKDDNGHLTGDNVADFVTGYYFRVLATKGNFAVSETPLAVRIHVTYYLTVSNAEVEVRICDNYATSHFETIGELKSTTQASRQTMSFSVPDNWVTSAMFNASGLARVLFRATRNGVATNLKIYHLWYEIDLETTGCSSAFQIQDCDSYEAMKLEVDTDLTLTNANMGLWETCPYSIIDYIKNHINGLVLASDPLFTLDTDIEATTGLTTRNYQERTTSEILKDLANMDKTVFWIALADHTTPTLIWKKTFAGGVTELTDASVLSWSGGEYDYLPMINEAHVYGARIGDSQLYIDTGALLPDPGAASKTKYEATRSAVIRNTGAVSEYEVTELGKALVTRDGDVHLYLRAEIAGLSAMRLGEEVNITSTYLGLPGTGDESKYVITHWTYNSNSARTSIRLHPRQSTGFIQHRMFGEHIKHIIDEAKLMEADKGTPSLTTQEW